MAKGRRKQHSKRRQKIKTNQLDIRRERVLGVRTQSGYNYGYELTGSYHTADRKRNVWDSGGYPELIEPHQHFNMVRRNGFASAAAFLPVYKTWQTFPEIFDGDEDPQRRAENPTEFEEIIDEYFPKWNFWERMKGLDSRQSVMRYGGLILTLKEPDGINSSPDKPPENIPSPEALVKMQPVYESQIPIYQAHQDPTKENYGDPKMFHFSSWEPGSRNAWKSNEMELHPDRVIAVGEGADDGSVYGIPALEGCYNALLDLEKVRMSSAEGFFVNASQKFAILLDPESVQGMNAEQAMEYNEAVDNMRRDMNTALTMAGSSIHNMQANMPDPKPSWEIAVNEVAAHRKIPATILMGQQTGRLASDEDKTVFMQEIMNRRNTWASDMVMQVIKHLQKIGILPESKGELKIVWDDLTSPSTEDEVKVIDQIAAASEKWSRAYQGEQLFPTGYVRSLLSSFDPAEYKGAMSDLPEPPEGKIDDYESKG